MIMNFYNPNNEMMSYVRIGFELTEQNIVKPSNFYRIVQIDINHARYTNTFDSFSEFWDNFYHFFQIIYWIVRLVLRVRYLKKNKVKYFTFYNVIIVFFTIGLTLTFVWEYLEIVYSEKQTEILQKIDPDYFISFFFSTIQTQILSICYFSTKIMMMIMVINEISFSELNKIKIIIKYSFMSLLGYTILLLIFIVFFTIFGYRMFGNKHYQFSTILNTLFAIFQSLMGTIRINTKVLKMEIEQYLNLYFIILLLVINYSFVFIF